MSEEAYIHTHVRGNKSLYHHLIIMFTDSHGREGENATNKLFRVLHASVSHVLLFSKVTLRPPRGQPHEATLLVFMDISYLISWLIVLFSLDVVFTLPSTVCQPLNTKENHNILHTNPLQNLVLLSLQGLVVSVHTFSYLHTYYYISKVEGGKWKATKGKMLTWNDRHGGLAGLPTPYEWVSYSKQPYRDGCPPLLHEYLMLTGCVAARVR